MAGTVKSAKIDNRTSRTRLRPGRHWRAIIPGRAHLGYQRRSGDREGRWVLRHYLGTGRYRIAPLGTADDVHEADGERVLSFEQAHANAVAQLNAPKGKVSRITVRQAMDRYVEFKRSQGQSIDDVTSRGGVHILPPLGDQAVCDLTAETLRRWLATMASSPAQVRPKSGGRPQYRSLPEDDEAIRKRRASANRVLTMLKAILNHCFDEEHVSNREAWGRRLKPFKEVDAPPVRYLSIAEAKRFLNACDPEFRPLARAALETGARYQEIARLKVVDFNTDSGTVAIRKSKTAKARHIILTDQGAAFFKEHCAGRAGSELMFTHLIIPRKSDLKVAGQKLEAKKPIKSPWKAAEQNRPMGEANERAKIEPPITLHGLRHTWASHAVMNSVPLIIVAKNLGHKDTRMVERVYGHLAPSFVVDAIRAGAPKFGFEPGKVVALSGART
jgi:integrase